MVFPASTVCLMPKASMLKPWVTLVWLPTLTTTLSPSFTLIGVLGFQPVPPVTGAAETDLWVVFTPHPTRRTAAATTDATTRRARFTRREASGTCSRAARRAGQ